MMDLSKYTFIQRQLSRLSLAVGCFDKMGPVPQLLNTAAVWLRPRLTKNEKKRGLRNASGYSLYLAQNAGDYTVTIESEHYLPKEFDIKLPDHDLPAEGEFLSPDGEYKLINLVPLESTPRNEIRGPLLAEVTLMPNSNYPFPVSATLIRGRVIEGSSQKAVPNALVQVEPEEPTSPPITLLFHADDRGQFVLYCNQLVNNDDLEQHSSPPLRDAEKIKVVQLNGKNYGANGILKIQVSQGNLSGLVNVEIIKNKSISVTIIL